MKTNRVLPFLLSLVLLLSALPFGVLAEGASDYLYTISDNGEVTITRYIGAGGAVTIPSEIEGCPVTCIGIAAFNMTYTTSITIPHSVTTIEALAFECIGGLTSITIPDSVVNMGVWVFLDCLSLRNIYCEADSRPVGWPEGWIGNRRELNLYWGVACTHEEIEVPEKPEDPEISIEPELPDVSIEPDISDEPVTSEADFEFLLYEYDDGSVYASVYNYIGNGGDVVIPSEYAGYPVRRIEGYAFAKHTEVTSVTIPLDINEIGEYAFAYALSLADIYCKASSQPDGWSEAWNADCGATVHWGNGEIDEPDLPIGPLPPDDVETSEVPDESEPVESDTPADGGDENTTWVPDEFEEPEVTQVPDESKETDDPVTPDIPDVSESEFDYEINDDGVSIIGYHGKGGHVVIPSTIEGYPVTTIYGAFCFCDTLTSITFPESVTFIGDKTFFGCTALKSFTIPRSVTVVGALTFAYCDSLTDIYCEVSEQPKDWSIYWRDECNATVHWGTGNTDEPDVPVDPDVPEIFYGDVTGDDAINGQDVVRLLQYLANLDLATGISSVRIGAGADCNGDGIINGKDATRLLRYLEDFDPLTGESSVTLGPTE